MIGARELDTLTEAQRDKLMKLLPVLPSTDRPIRQAQTLLVNGFDVEFVAEYTGVKLEKVQQMYSESWNPRCRIPLSQSSVARNTINDRRRKALLLWECGYNIEDIAKELKVSVYHIWSILGDVISRPELDARLPKPGTRAHHEFTYLYCQHSRK